MCGISGICYFGSSGEASPQDETRTVLARLNQAQVHRGPDDEGIWLASDGRVGFGHRRLSIIDLSSAAISSWPTKMAVSGKSSLGS